MSKRKSDFNITTLPTKRKKLYQRARNCEDFLLTPCFAIGPDVQLKEIPSSGEEYLLKVINERQYYAVVTKCNKDFSKYAPRQTVFANEIPFPKFAPELKPTIEWQYIQIAKFAKMCQYVLQVRANKSIWPFRTKTLRGERVPLKTWSDDHVKMEPTLSYIIALKQGAVDNRLMVLNLMLGEVKPGDTMDHIIGKWVYSLMVCIRQPVIAETIYIIRDIARKCATIRSHIDLSREDATLSLAPLNLIICLVARYFEQYDLAD